MLREWISIWIICLVFLSVLFFASILLIAVPILTQSACIWSTLRRLYCTCLSAETMCVIYVILIKNEDLIALLTVWEFPALAPPSLLQRIIEIDLNLLSDIRNEILIVYTFSPSFIYIINPERAPTDVPTRPPKEQNSSLLVEGKTSLIS